MKAIMDRVFIKPDESRQGAIIIEDESKTKSGIVQSIGEDVKAVEVGDHVIFYDWADLPAMDGLIAVRESYLLGKIEDD